MTMRDELSFAAGQLERKFGVLPRIRGSLHFGTVIGDLERAIVFNSDVMNAAARLEEVSRNVEGGFLASRSIFPLLKRHDDISVAMDLTAHRVMAEGEVRAGSKMVRLSG